MQISTLGHQQGSIVQQLLALSLGDAVLLQFGADFLVFRFDLKRRTALFLPVGPLRLALLHDFNEGFSEGPFAKARLIRLGPSRLTYLKEELRSLAVNLVGGINLFL